MITRTLNMQVLEELSENMPIDQLVEHLTYIAAQEVGKDDESADDNSKK